MSLEKSKLEKSTLSKVRKTIFIQALWQVGMNSPGVEEPGMLYNDFTATWETLFVLSSGSMTNNRSKGRMSNDEQGVGSPHITNETE